MNKKDKIEANAELQPNKFLQPFAHQQWKIIGSILEYNESKTLAEKKRPFYEFVNRFSKNFGGVIGIIIVFHLLLAAFILPFIKSGNANATDFNIDEKYLPFFTKGDNGFYYILGTDAYGRDVWLRLWEGLRFSLALSLVASTINTIVGVIIGVLMGQFVRFDKVLNFIIKIISNIPAIMILILLTIILKPSFWILVFGFSITGWMGMAIQVRAQVKRARNYQWVAASRLLGTPKRKILLNYLPVILPIIITQLVFMIPGIILGETGLAIIGLSLQDVPTLGTLISDGAKIVTIFPRYALTPSALLVMLTTSVQLIGSSVQDSLRRQR